MEVLFYSGDACRYPIVKKAAQDLNWRLFCDEDDSKAIQRSHVIWIDTGNINDVFCKLKPWQLINHFPGIQHIARKTLMAYQLGVMQRKFKADFSFHPKTFVLPRDIAKLKAEFRFPFGRSKTAYIIKPDGGSQGRGIFLTRNLKEIESLATSHVVQQYISNPLLIEQKKFDLRLYVLMTSCFPLRVYIFRNGLVRLCTKDYEKATDLNMSELNMHLTNYSLNKRVDSFEKPSDDDALGCFGSKRSVEWFFSWLSKTNGTVAANKLWREIGHISVMTIISVLPILSKEYSSLFGYYWSEEVQRNEPQVIGSRCFSILGFDVLINDKLKPFVIEVNHLSSFGTDSELDEKIKYDVVYQALSVQRPISRDHLVRNEVKSETLRKTLKMTSIARSDAKSVARRAVQTLGRRPSSSSYRSNKNANSGRANNNVAEDVADRQRSNMGRLTVEALARSNSSSLCHDSGASDEKFNVVTNAQDMEFQQLVTFGGYDRLYPPCHGEEINPPYEEMIEFINEHFTKLYQKTSSAERLNNMLREEQNQKKTGKQNVGTAAVKFPPKSKSVIFDRLSRGLSAKISPCEEHPNESYHPVRSKYGAGEENVLNKRPFPIVSLTLELNT